jgi:hypothetical protein
VGVEGALRELEYELEREEHAVEPLEEVNLSEERTTSPDFLRNMGVVSNEHEDELADVHADDEYAPGPGRSSRMHVSDCAFWWSGRPIFFESNGGSK